MVKKTHFLPDDCETTSDFSLRIVKKQSILTKDHKDMRDCRQNIVEKREFHQSLMI